MEEITCKVTGIKFENRSTGFFILTAVPAGQHSFITIKGNFPGTIMAVGLKVKFCGEWGSHPVYGRQLLASTCEVLPEKGRNGIVTYLSSHVPSIGPITATKLYDALGDNLIHVLENDPDQIKSLPFLTRPQADAVINEWRQSSYARTAAIFLADLGLNASQIKSVYSKFDSRTSDLVRSDPYCLYKCPGVGFATADSAARKLGVGVDDERRIRSIIMYTMNEMSQSEGHTYATTPQILAFVGKLFKKRAIESFSHGDFLSDSHYYLALTQLLANGDLVSVNDCIYLSQHWYYESSSSEAIARIAVQPPCDFGNLESILADFEEKRGLSLADEQRQAFMMLEDSRAIVISGYPGTGKTLLISAFVHLFEKLNLNYSLLSPTGIAAKRLSQVTGKPASTIHRALGYGKDGVWSFNSDNRYITDAIIVDEMSMVDSATFYHLVTALKSSTIIVLVGDSAQLPSVGAGYVLNNLMRCPDLPHIALTRIYRQSKQSDIVSVAHTILRGERINTEFNKDSEFVFLEHDKDKVVDEICQMTSKMKDRNFNFQVIAPIYDGDLGVSNLNKKLREVLNTEFASGKAAKLKHGETDLYEGDRVMVIKNDYDKMVFNGDVGKIQRINPKADEIEVKIFDWFDQESPVPRYIDKVFTFRVEEARHVLRVAYACTAHKTQGQEFDFVLLPMTMQYGFMLYRNLLYTAITRAKRKVFMFGDPKAFQYGVSNARETIRNSNLSTLTGEAITALKSMEPSSIRSSISSLKAAANSP